MGEEKRSTTMQTIQTVLLVLGFLLVVAEGLRPTCIKLDAATCTDIAAPGAEVYIRYQAFSTQEFRKVLRVNNKEVVMARGSASFVPFIPQISGFVSAFVFAGFSLQSADGRSFIGIETSEGTIVVELTRDMLRGRVSAGTSFTANAVGININVWPGCVVTSADCADFERQYGEGIVAAITAADQA